MIRVLPTPVQVAGVGARTLLLPRPVSLPRLVVEVFANILAVSAVFR